MIAVKIKHSIIIIFYQEYSASHIIPKSIYNKKINVLNMKIHGIVWIIVGGIVSGFSKFIESLKPSAKLEIFFYLGLGFIAFGIFKLVVSFIISDKKQKQRIKDSKFKNRFGVSEKVAGMINKDLKNVNINRDVYRQKQEIEQKIKNNRRPSNSFQNQQQIYQQPHSQRIICPVCGSSNYAYANFCTICGTRLK